MDQLLLAIASVSIVLYPALLVVFFIVLKKEIEKIRNDIRQINQKPAFPQKKSKVDHVPTKKPNRLISIVEKINNEVIVSICRNKTSRKYFIYLKDADRDHSKMITPEGKIKNLSNSLFDEIEEEKLLVLISTNRLSVEQVEAFNRISSDTKVTPPKEEGGRELGSKSNENLKDYLIPVLQLIYKGYDYKEAFHIVKDHLNVRYNTVSAQCTRSLGLTTDEFVLMAKNKSVIQLLKDKFPDRIDVIETELPQEILG
jgi:hypothetical protein